MVEMFRHIFGGGKKQNSETQKCPTTLESELDQMRLRLNQIDESRMTVRDVPKRVKDCITQYGVDPGAPEISSLLGEITACADTFYTKGSNKERCRSELGKMIEKLRSTIRTNAHLIHTPSDTPEEAPPSEDTRDVDAQPDEITPDDSPNHPPLTASSAAFSPALDFPSKDSQQCIEMTETIRRLEQEKNGLAGQIYQQQTELHALRTANQALETTQQAAETAVQQAQEQMHAATRERDTRIDALEKRVYELEGKLTDVRRVQDSLRQVAADPASGHSLQNYVQNMLKLLALDTYPPETWGNLQQYVYLSAESRGLLAHHKREEYERLQQIILVQNAIHARVREASINVICPAAGDAFDETYHQATEQDLVWVNDNPALHNHIHSVRLVGFEDTRSGRIEKAKVKRYVYLGADVPQADSPPAAPAPVPVPEEPSELPPPEHATLETPTEEAEPVPDVPSPCPPQLPETPTEFETPQPRDLDAELEGLV